MKIILIAAIGRNRELGKNNELLWKLHDDMYRFSILTRDKIVVMGRKTLESIGKPLPRRDILVLTRNEAVAGFNKKEGELPIARAMHSIQDILEYAKANYAEEIYVAGGGSIYYQFLPFADELDLTMVDAEDAEADTFFPEFTEGFYERMSLNMKDEKTGLDYKFTRWCKK